MRLILRFPSERLEEALPVKHPARGWAEQMGSDLLFSSQWLGLLLLMLSRTIKILDFLFYLIYSNPRFIVERTIHRTLIFNNHWHVVFLELVRYYQYIQIILHLIRNIKTLKCYNVALTISWRSECRKWCTKHTTLP